MGGKPAQVIVGEIVEVEETYLRERPVGLPILAGLLTAAGIARAGVLLVSTVLRRGAAAGAARRSFKELRKGPEIPVTPLLVRDTAGFVVELEVLGYVSPNTFIAHDRIAATVLPQKAADLPPRAARIENLTSGRTFAPHPPTLLGHLGPALLLQAIVGAILGVLLVACLLGAFRR
jgi:hypothetical protein